MNKSDLVTALANEAGMTKADASRIVESLFAPDAGIIARSLKKGDKVQISGFGTFEAKNRKARTGRNPRTGETIKIPATTAPTFRAGKGLKDQLG